jgi:hypothetical protein
MFHVKQSCQRVRIVSFADFVEDRIDRLREMANLPGTAVGFPLQTISVRVPVDVRIKIDLIGQFTAMNRQETLRAMIEAACDDGVRFLKDDGPAFDKAFNEAIAQFVRDLPGGLKDFQDPGAA